MKNLKLDLELLAILAVLVIIGLVGYSKKRMEEQIKAKKQIQTAIKKVEVGVISKVSPRDTEELPRIIARSLQHTGGFRE